eukprot:scaffold111401_cov16-Tisochrysis_lutea.AAC.1
MEVSNSGSTASQGTAQMVSCCKLLGKAYTRKDTRQSNKNSTQSNPRKPPTPAKQNLWKRVNEQQQECSQGGNWMENGVRLTNTGCHGEVQSNKGLLLTPL